MTAEERVKVMLERRGSSFAAIATTSRTSAREGRGSGGGAGLATAFLAVAVFFAGAFAAVFFVAAPAAVFFVDVFLAGTLVAGTFAVAFFAVARLVGCDDGVAAVVVCSGVGASPASVMAAALLGAADVLAAARSAADWPAFLAVGRFAAGAGRAAGDSASPVGSPAPRPGDAAVFRVRAGAAAFDGTADCVDAEADPLRARRRCVVFAGVARPASGEVPGSAARASGSDVAASSGGAAATLSSGIQTFLILDRDLCKS